ncbi:hypothetical protein SAMN05216338_105768 [Bradyrhizobium sp. Rc2d]|nr:hypothetical protein SAMN05216338_105768 [Bradyrhizobium sp. Rc2d]
MGQLAIVSTFAWKWMLDPTFSVLNWLLYHFGHRSARRNAARLGKECARAD